jgi:chorismate synthase
MASNSFGTALRITSFGESHGPALGVVVDGCPAGIPLAEADFLPELARRRPGQSAVTSARQEPDRPELLSGVFEGRTTGSPIAVLVRNVDARPQDYEALRAAPRPGHADQTWSAKYGHRDPRGGGRASGRETIARVLGGVVARRLLPPATRIVGHALQIGPFRAARYEPETIERNPVRCADPDVAARIVAHLEELRAQHDSTGGLVEIRVHAPPPNLGEPTFGKLKARLADAILSVGAVTGFAYGAGFDVATMRGSEYVADRGAAGGILGGISTGDDLRLLAGIKPASSVGAIAQHGRHDPCVVPRVIPVLEAMVALVLADLLLLDRMHRG